jgi:K+-transporting ATPase KdpF subunit
MKIQEIARRDRDRGSGLDRPDHIFCSARLNVLMIAKPIPFTFLYGPCRIDTSLHFLYIWPSNLYKFLTSFPLRFHHQDKPERGDDGPSLSRSNRCLLSDDRGFRRCLRQHGGTSVNPFYVLGAVVACALLVYLVAALLMAEDL